MHLLVLKRRDYSLVIYIGVTLNAFIKTKHFCLKYVLNTAELEGFIDAN